MPRIATLFSILVLTVLNTTLFKVVSLQSLYEMKRYSRGTYRNDNDMVSNACIARSLSRNRRSEMRIRSSVAEQVLTERERQRQKLVSKDSTGKADKFDFGLAIILAGFSFEAYNDPVKK